MKVLSLIFISILGLNTYSFAHDTCEKPVLEEVKYFQDVKHGTMKCALLISHGEGNSILAVYTDPTHGNCRMPSELMTFVPVEAEYSSYFSSEKNLKIKVLTSQKFLLIDENGSAIPFRGTPY